MKIVKSMVLGAVATLIVAAGPEAAAPVLGVSVSAEAAVKPALKCKNPTLYQVRPAGTLLKNGKRSLKAACVLKKPKKAKRCKAGATLKTSTKPLESGKIISTSTCKKAAAKPTLKCKPPTFFQAKGTVIGGTLSKPVVSKADACVSIKKK